MRLTSLSALAGLAIGHVAARAGNDSCIPSGAIPDVPASSLRNWGMVLFRAVDMIDVFGTLDPLQLMAHSEQQMNLFFLAETMDQVTTETSSPAMNPHNSSFWPLLTPTHTFDQIAAGAADLDVLIVPGGPGARAPDATMEPVFDFLREMFPKVKIFITVCTGSMVAARAGVLDGHMATTNKAAWESVLAVGPEVDWVSPARYVVDGKVWTSSGVTSALDLIFHLMETYWSTEVKDRIAGMIEHVPREATDDPFSEYYGIAPTEAQPCRDE